MIGWIIYLPIKEVLSWKTNMELVIVKHLLYLYGLPNMRGKKGIKTGRKRTACSHLVCEYCGKTYPVDDTFDGEWRYK